MDPRPPLRPTAMKPYSSHYASAMTDPLQPADNPFAQSVLVAPAGRAGNGYTSVPTGGGGDSPPAPAYGGTPAPTYHHSVDHSIDLSDHPPRLSESASYHSRSPLHRAAESTDHTTPSRPTLSEKVGGTMYATPPPVAGVQAHDYMQAQRVAPNAPYPPQPNHNNPANVNSTTNLTNPSTTMVFAEGDGPLPENKRTKNCMSVIANNIFVRWFFFITPIMIIIWIPGVLGFLSLPNATILGVKLIWWSVWLTIWWGSWWVGLAVAKIAPSFLHYTFGQIFLGMNKWFGYLSGMTKPITFFTWALLSWITFNIFIIRNQPSTHTTDQGSGKTLHLMIQFLFGVFIASVGFVIEKLVIQIIASNFHRKSYEDRILEQKASIRSLTALYVNSHDIGRSDTLDRGGIHAGKNGKDPAHFLRSALKGVRNVAQAGTTVFGTVASEIAGERILQPNAPESVVTSALSSANKTRQLARRLYYSFVPRGRQELLVTDVARFFPNMDAAQEAFKVLDKDENGDASLEEMEMSCLDLHRDRLALASSMRDLDSAVGRLDGIFMVVFWIVAVLIVVALMDVSFQTMLASAGTLVLGLSWLIGATAQEVLSSILFLFVKHPYDVADRVDIDGQAYVVKEISLLYTVFRQTDGKVAQIPHSSLNSKSVINIRRSGPISEAFEFDVDFGTTFHQIEALRARMLEFLEAERRDFLPSINISIKDFVEQGSLKLACDINYKSNWQNGALKVQRRNKWLCGLKLAMAEVKIWGPAGAGNPSPGPADPTVIKFHEGGNGLHLPFGLGGNHSRSESSRRGSRAATGVAENVPNTADVVNHLTFASRDAALRDMTSDIFDESSGLPSRDASLSSNSTRQRQPSIQQPPFQQQSYQSYQQQTLQQQPLQQPPSHQQQQQQPQQQQQQPQQQPHHRVDLAQATELLRKR